MPKGKPKPVMSRPVVKYDPPATMALICERMAEGKSLRQICAEEGMPSKTLVMRWLNVPGNGAFVDHYARAREALADAYAEQIIEIVDSKDEDANSRRVRMDARKWVASKLAPKKYGEKIGHEHAGIDGGPILIATGVIRAGD
jgi:hypothetical protein